MRHKRAAWLLCAALVVVACGGGDDERIQQTSLSFKGDAGDYISQGKSGFFTDATGTVSTTYENGYFRTRFQGPNLSYWWYLDLASPNGEALVPGTYNDAWRAPLRNGNNGLEFSGDGRGCNTVFGKFNVLEVGYDTTGRLNRFAADFEQRCETVTSPLVRGSIRINSAIAATY
jgi:hypothetical protein